MKKVMLISILLCSSCVMHTPATDTRLEIGYEEDKGVFISAKAFDSNIVMEWLKVGYEFITPK